MVKCKSNKVKEFFMNKTLSKILIGITAFALVLTIAGCALFALFDNGNISNIPNSAEASKSVSFNVDQSTENLSDPNAAAKVARSAVKIKMVYSAGVSYGSGVIVDIDDADYPRTQSEFYIITCHHVVASGGTVYVYVPDSDWRNDGDPDYDTNYVFSGIISNQINDDKAVTLVGGDQDSDIAVLKLDVGEKKNAKGNFIKNDIVESSIANDKPMYFEEVFAIGNPSGTLPMSAVGGNISYIDRELVMGSVGYMNLLQIDAMIKHGSSGGGLFNMKGQLIGITNGGSDTYIGMNYAIPFYGEYGFVNIAKQLIGTRNELKEVGNYGYVDGRWRLGITVEEKSNQFGAKYVLISSVVDGDNGALAGLSAGSIVEALVFNGVTYKIETADDFATAIYKIKDALRKDTTLKKEIIFDIYASGSGRANIKVGLENKQFIFCDTGNYPN